MMLLNDLLLEVNWLKIPIITRTEIIANNLNRKIINQEIIHY